MVNFRAYSHYSNFESIIKIDSLVQFCIDNNIRVCAICDKMNLFGAAEFSSYCIKNKITPIIGCLLNVNDIGWLSVYIYNQQGYHNLSFLLSQVYMNGKESIDIEELYAYKEGLIVFTGDESIFNGLQTTLNVQDILMQMHEEFKENLLLEINLVNDVNEVQIVNWSNELKIPIVCTSTTRFLSAEDAKAMQIFKMIKDGDMYDETASFSWSNMYYPLKWNVKPEIAIGIQNAINVARKCQFFLETQKPIIPKYNLQQNIDVVQELYTQIFDGLKAKNKYNDTYIKRIETEMSVLITKNFCEYFLVTADFIRYAKEKNINVGPGRGSGAGCLIAYCLNITAIDPIEHGLLFERFLNPERASLPDFDIDFEPERRHEVIEYLMRKYGKYGVAHIITYIVLQARAVIRDVGRVCRIPFRQLNHITSLVPEDQINPVKLAEAMNMVAELKELYEKDERFKFILNIALKLEGCVRNFSKHAAGVIISHIPIYERCPLYKDAKGDIVTQFDLNYLEKVGLIKFDFLGLKTLTYLNDTVKAIGTNIDLNELPLNDQKVFETLCNTNDKLPLEGVFQFEGNALNTIMTNLKPTEFNDLVALNALYRPGPIDSIPSYIKRKHGKEQIIYLHNDLSKEFHDKLHAVLGPTYGILVYQEQVMSVTCILAGFSLAEADLLRRAMGKKKHDEMIANRKKFCEGCMTNGISQSVAEDIFHLIEKFSGYGFNKSHSAPYSLIAYQCLYLKVHYIKEFTESYLKSESGDIYKITKYLYEMKRKGYNICKPNVQISNTHCSLKNKDLYIGLREIKNVNEVVASSIALQAPYKNIYEFMQKNVNHINRKNWEGLVYSGALDTLLIHNQVTPSNVYIKRNMLVNNMQEIMAQQMVNQNLSPIQIEQEIENNQNVYAISPEFIGDIFENILKSLGIVKISSMNSGNYIVCATVLSIKRKRKSSRVYAFLEICDSSEMCDFVLSAELLIKYGDILKEGRQFIFKIKFHENKASLISIYKINDFLNSYKHMQVTVDHRKEIPLILKIAADNIGDSNLHIKYHEEVITAPNKVSLSLNSLYNLLQPTYHITNTDSLQT